MSDTFACVPVYFKSGRELLTERGVVCRGETGILFPGQMLPNVHDGEPVTEGVPRNRNWGLPCSWRSLKVEGRVKLQ